MSNDTEFIKSISNIKENSKYLKLSYFFHNAKSFIEEHSTLNTFNRFLRRFTSKRS